MSRKMSDRSRRELRELVIARDAGPDGHPICGGSSPYGCKEPVDPAVWYRDRKAPTLDHLNNDKTDHRLENLVIMHRACNSSKGKRFSDARRRSDSAQGSHPSEAPEGHHGSTSRPGSDGSIYIHTPAFRTSNAAPEMASVEYSRELTRRIAAVAQERIKDFPDGIPWREFAAALAEAAKCTTPTAEEKLEQLTSRANPDRFLDRKVVDGLALVVPRNT